MTGEKLHAGVITPLFSGVRRLVAPNAGMMTGPGTNTYLLGEQEIAVIDPGPAMSVHIQRILSEAAGPICWILVTHTHPDHSPAALALAAETGAQVLGIVAPEGRHQDRTFAPDREMADGDIFSTNEFVLEIVHTPGHASNHLCFLHREHRLLFTGDHIINGSTVVIDPPDGSMADYLDSLQKLKQKKINAIAPGHGAIMANAYEAIDWLIEHRLYREAKVIESLRLHPSTALEALVTYVYDEVDTRLHPIAARSLLAHLLKLEEEGRASNKADRWSMT